MITSVLAFCGFVGLAAAQGTITNTPTGVVSPTGSSAGIPLPAGFNPVNGKFNYTRTWSPVIPITSPAIPGNPAWYTMSTTYANGLGQPLQTNLRRTKDLVTVYDNRSLLDKPSYLSYPANTGGIGFQYTPFTDQKAYYDANFPDEGDNAYARTKVIFSGSQTSIATYEPGMARTGSDRGKVQSVSVNGSGIIKFGTASYWTELYPKNNGYYAPGDLKALKVEGQHGAASWEYKNKNGNTVCSQTEAGMDGNSEILTTCYVYDDLGRIIWVITPKAYEALAAAGWPSPGAGSSIQIYDKLCYGYTYNRFGQVTSRRIPGKEGFEFMVYNKHHKAALSQTPLLASQGKWAFQVYDSRDRVVFSGFVNTSYDLAQWESLIGPGSTPVPGSLEDYLSNGFRGAYPASLTNVEINSYNYYDSYAFDATFPYTRSFSANYSSSYGTSIYSTTPVPFNYVNGLLTASKTRVIGNGTMNEWISNIYFYDQKSRPIQVHTLNPWNAANWDISTTQYNFDGSIATSILDHQGFPGTSKPNTTIVLRNNYVDGRLLSQKLKLDNKPEVVLANYLYDDFGRVKTKSIGNGVEKQVYTYNIRGQLTGINADYIDNPAYPDATFGCALSYDYGFDLPRYDNAISGMRWRGAGSAAEPRAYGYAYDKAGRMTGADFNEIVGSLGGSWNKYDHDYSVGNITYDANGNMLSMDQKGVVVGGTTQIIDMDKLTYVYKPYSNTLDRVEDAMANNALNDFTNRNAGTTDYTYDANGNLTADLNKAITSINYNELDLPLDVATSGNGSVNNIYDASGTLIQKTITQASGPIEVLNYWGPFVYSNQNLQYVLHSEGRARWKNGLPDYQYDYFIKDHLGNVRSVVNHENASIRDYLATHELSSSAVEHMLFEMPTTAPKPLPGPNDETAAELVASNPAKRVGTSLLLKVMAGDKFKAQVSAYYEDNQFNPNGETTSSSAMMSSLFDALSGGITGLGTENGGLQLLNNMFSGSQLSSGFNSMKEEVTDPNQPRAYLNYVFLDEDMNLRKEGSGALQVGAASIGAWADIGTPNDIVIDKNGYLLIYMSNETNSVNVFMDDFLVTYSRGKLLEEQHYYPHGLVVSNGSNTPLVNKYLHQGKELQKEAGLELYDFHARQYDPQIGRFWGIDPANQFPSGYTGMGNDPANMIDPTGMVSNRADDVVAAAEFGSSDIHNPFHDGTWSETGTGLDPQAFAGFMAMLKLAQEGGNANSPKESTQGESDASATYEITMDDGKYSTNQYDRKAGNSPPIDYSPDDLKEILYDPNYGMTLSEQGYDFLKAWESFRGELYDAGDGMGTRTIGYGYVVPKDQVADYKKNGITEARADQLLRQEMKQYQKQVIAQVRVKLTQNQFDALTILTYNLGLLRKASTLVRSINKGMVDDINTNWLSISQSNGRVLQGLINRRTDELQIWFNSNYTRDF